MNGTGSRERPELGSWRRWSSKTLKRQGYGSILTLAVYVFSRLISSAPKTLEFSAASTLLLLRVYFLYLPFLVQNKVSHLSVSGWGYCSRMLIFFPHGVNRKGDN
ncbi:hypothetical protein EYC80_010096 [Monilinia laxa]|uniref:Uncharacterized protein n=1 Tax=Monilinia laxa TaxID=61186 RepID=A0A5N6JRM2_MONLA|nr:hypothetical protein EYC80_010096 [Monilinia laxa]